MTVASTAARLRGSLSGLVHHPEFRLGAREVSGVAPGLAAWGLMTGVAMVNSGMSAVEAVAMTLLVFAGSSQLAAIPLIAASAPVWVILAAGFCVNLRFVVFSAHLRSYVMHLPRWVRLLAGYLSTDMTYVLFVRRFSQPPVSAAQPDEKARASRNIRPIWVNGSSQPGCASMTSPALSASGRSPRCTRMRFSASVKSEAPAVRRRVRNRHRPGGKMVPRRRLELPRPFGH